MEVSDIMNIFESFGDAVISELNQRLVTTTTLAALDTIVWPGFVL